MRDKQPDHPELIAGPNPLLEALSPFISLKSLPAALCEEPLAEVKWRSIAPARREPFLMLSDKHYWPITPHVHVAAEIQLMLRSGLVQRNPMSPEEQRRVNMLSLANSVETVKLPTLRKRAGGSILAAITGLGKSTLVERILAVLAPQQVVVHGINKECGWSVLTQVAYLIVNAPSNATRKGLFAAIIGALDALIGTTYADDLKRQKNLDEAMVYVAKVLSIHRVGLLVIDENQASTLAENIWGDEFVQYFLGLMNLGIPVLLVGNPMAFSDLDASAQLLRRFATHGWHELKPATKSEDDSWWNKQFLPGVARFTLCEEVPSVDEIRNVTSEIDGGIPGVFLAIWKEAQKIALRRGGKAACLTTKDLRVAASSPSVAKLLDIGRAASTGNMDAQFVDLPRKLEASDQVGAGNTMSVSSEGAGEVLRRIERQLKQKESRQREKKERDKVARETLTEDDLRRGANALAMLAGKLSDQGELEV